MSTCEREPVLEEGQLDDSSPTRTGAARRIPTPVRGTLGLSISTSSPETVAGSDFSIFVVVNSPFEVPITLYQVRTHIPVELMDMNQALIAEAAASDDGRDGRFSSLRRLRQTRALRRRLRDGQTGIATARGTDVAPGEAGELMQATVNVGGSNAGTVAGVLIQFPENPSSDELDAIFRRFADYRRGVVPETLQPGDSVVRQFVLRTRQWLLFTPLADTFQIQATYALDGCDHTTIAPYELQI